MTRINLADVFVWTLGIGFGGAFFGVFSYSFLFWVNPLTVIGEYNALIRGWVIAIFIIAFLAYALEKGEG